MSTLVRTVLLPYSAECLYTLVNDVIAYPGFLPGCQSVEVLEHSGAKITARIHVAAKGFSESFTTTNTLVPHSRIDLTLSEGPFEHFAGYWLFQPLGTAGCKVTLSLDFGLRGLLRAVEPLTGKAADAIVDAFVERAKVICKR
jgi:ribosome-associated toxin RatA of RatAB toxin-antitoxin module